MHRSSHSLRTPRWRVVVFVVLALVAAGCRDDEPTTIAISGIPVPESTTTTEPAETTTTSTTTSTTTTTEPASSTAASAGRIEPRVLCVDNLSVAYFTYSSTHDEPVTVEVGEGNQILGPDGEPLTTNQTETFAPGEGGQVAAWVEVFDEATWTIENDDGAATAVATPDSRPCPELREPDVDPPDTRTATVSPSIEVTRDADGSVATATVSFALDGLPAESICPSGSYPWTPLEPEVRASADGDNVVVVDNGDPAVAVVEIEDPQRPTDEDFLVVGFATVDYAVDVYDRCVDADGAVTTSWAASPALLDLSQFTEKFCFGTVTEDGEETVTVVDCSNGPQIGFTGGIRLR